MAADDDEIDLAIRCDANDLALDGAHDDTGVGVWNFEVTRELADALLRSLDQLRLHRQHLRPNRLRRYRRDNWHRLNHGDHFELRAECIRQRACAPANRTRFGG